MTLFTHNPVATASGRKRKLRPLQPGGAFNAYDLLAPVGPEAPNRANDVAAVGALLHEAGYLDRPGKNAVDLSAATRDFQQDAGEQVDGLINPKGPTHRALGKSLGFSADDNRQATSPRKPVIAKSPLSHDQARSNQSLADHLTSKTTAMGDVPKLVAEVWKEKSDQGDTELSDLFSKISTRDEPTAKRLAAAANRELDADGSAPLSLADLLQAFADSQKQSPFSDNDGEGDGDENEPDDPDPNEPEEPDPDGEEPDPEEEDPDPEEEEEPEEPEPDEDEEEGPSDEECQQAKLERPKIAAELAEMNAKHAKYFAKQVELERQLADQEAEVAKLLEMSEISSASLISRFLRAPGKVIAGLTGTYGKLLAAEAEWLMIEAGKTREKLAEMTKKVKEIEDKRATLEKDLDEVKETLEECEKKEKS